MTEFKNMAFEGDLLQGVVLDLLGNTPTADVAEVVRCKDCAGGIKHKAYPDIYKCNGCNYVRGRLVTSTFGCTAGKPKERTDT
jgi:hypothetical protein